MAAQRERLRFGVIGVPLNECLERFRGVCRAPRSDPGIGKALQIRTDDLPAEGNRLFGETRNLFLRYRGHVDIDFLKLPIVDGRKQHDAGRRFIGGLIFHIAFRLVLVQIPLCAKFLLPRRVDAADRIGNDAKRKE